MKKNSIFEDFCKQRRYTLSKFLNALAANPAVKSVHLNGLPPFLTNYDVSVYCNDTELVVLCLDCCGHNAKNIYEESECLNAVVLSEYTPPRVSVVWQLAETVSALRNLFEEKKAGLAVYGVLLTEANILNCYVLKDLWCSHQVLVIDDFSRLRSRKIRVSADNDTANQIKQEIEKIIEKNDNPFCRQNNNAAIREMSDEMRKLINDFIKNNKLENKLEEDDDDEDINNDDDDDDDNDDDEDIGFPFPFSTDNTIQFGGSNSTKVEILQPIENPRKELENLVGCDEIKHRMDELIKLTQYNKMMREIYPDSKKHEVSLHSVFLGRPGTGKTTVCKIFGALLHEAGALSKGHVVVCDRSTFLGPLWGDEEKAVKQAIEMAQGGVLMIDEAYLLTGRREGDPDRLVLQQMMNILADESKRDIAVVLCGYKAPMMQMLNMNPGLQSRFPNMFEFTDFNVEELMEIARRRVSEYHYNFSIHAWEKLHNILTAAYCERDPETWGNARFVANLLERVYVQHAVRCMKQPPAHQYELLMLTPEDILPIEVPRKQAKVGF